MIYISATLTEYNHIITMKFSIFVTFCFVTLVTVTAVPTPQTLDYIDEGRIVGGEVAKDGQFPHMVILKNTTATLRCGGSLITIRTVLTADHCISGVNAKDHQVKVGTNNLAGGTEYAVDKFILHENTKYSYHDIGLVILKEAVSLGPLVKFVKLPPANLQITPGDIATVSGWGRTSYPGNRSEQLLFLNVELWSLEECEKVMAVEDNNVCAGGVKGQGACHGDSGSALINKDGVQIGIVSRGIPCAKGIPDVYASVPFFVDWINENKVE